MPGRKCFEGCQCQRHSAAFRQHMSAVHKGRKQDPAVVERRAAKLRGRTKTPEERHRYLRPVHSKIKNGYVVITGVDHPLAASGSVAEHRRVLYDAIGPGPHTCEVRFMCDGTALLEWSGTFGINVDHIDNNTLNNARENLRVACWHCNRNRRNPNHGGDADA